MVQKTTIVRFTAMAIVVAGSAFACGYESAVATSARWNVSCLEERLTAMTIR
jgi:hypothetical protein